MLMLRRILLAAPLVMAVAMTADASQLPLSVFGGTWATKAERVLVWANSPQTSLAFDNRRGTNFANVALQWENLVPGAYLSTPEGVVIASSRTGDAMSAQLTVPARERQTWALNPNINGAYRFAVIGKTHHADSGQRTYGVLAKRMGDQKNQFALHLGDAVAGGNPRQLELFREQLKAFPFPTYALPGGADVAGEGKQAWSRLFGGLPLAYKVDRDRFIMLDNVSGTLKKEERTWLERTLQQANDTNARHIFVFLNKPLVDPRPGLNKGMTKIDEVRSLLNLFQRHRVRMVFASHLPIFSREKRKGVDYVITGGGGDALYGTPKQGGFHHYVQVDINGDAVNAYPVRTP
ncbi:3',5'-cyclic adenosine monophosphate phosphodiesterase CpdA [compost metagenome]